MVRSCTWFLKNMVIIALAIFISACSKITQENFDRIQPGMSMQQVVTILGDPNAAQSINFGGISGSSATWKGKDAEIDIQFLNDKVQIKSFNKSGATNPVSSENPAAPDSPS